MPIITLHTTIKAPIQLVFDLARSVDIHTLSTQQTNEQAVDGKTTGLLGLDEWVTWRAKHFGVYWRLTSQITEFKPPYYFVDEMQKGIFKRFKHEHIFEEKEDGQTLMADIFDYTSPFGALGNIADMLFLKTYMSRFLQKRNEVIKEEAERNRNSNF